MAGRDSETKGFLLISSKYCPTPASFSLAHSLESSQLHWADLLVFLLLPGCERNRHLVGLGLGFEKQRSRGVPGPCLGVELSMRKRSQIHLLPPHQCIGRPHNATAETNTTHNTATPEIQLQILRSCVQIHDANPHHKTCHIPRQSSVDAKDSWMDR